MSDYLRLLDVAREHDHLFSVQIELTYGCNLDCVFCYNDTSLRGAPLQCDDYKGLLDDLAGMEVMNISLTGGEPLLSRHFFHVGAEARKLGFVVRVKTNGHALRGDLLKRLQDEIDPFEVEVSLHGASAATHDRQTRVPGSFDRLLDNLRECKRAGLRIRLSVVVTKWNGSELQSMADLGESIGYRIRFDPVLTPRDDGDPTPRKLEADAETFRRLFRLEQRLASPERGGKTAPPSEPSGRHCAAGGSVAAVDPFGNVYPCVAWRVPLGNLRKAPFPEIWRGDVVEREVRDVQPEIRKMVGSLGPSGRKMGFCPGIAFSISGDPLSVYNAAKKRIVSVDGTASSPEKKSGRMES